jgi:hypothetical protein
MRSDGRDKPSRTAERLSHRQHGDEFDRHKPQSGSGHGRIADRGKSKPEQHDDRVGQLLGIGWLLVNGPIAVGKNGAPQARRSHFCECAGTQRTNSRIA